ncbi:MAG: sigma 54-interacting transcriptional regulator [Myxococcota bacterium]
MAGRFEVLRSLGEGGQGRVVAVRDAARGGSVLALKETAPGRADDLRREFALLSGLRHPNLAAVHDWLPRSPLAPEWAAYTQDLVDGVDLWRALRDAPEPDRACVFEQVLRALAHLHAVGVVHLDLKPDNVIVGEGGARVLDFGVAAAVGDAGEGVRGSRSYVAPERLEGRPPEPRADLYALGVMMAEVWLGAPPTPADLASPLADGSARRAWLRERGVPDGWADVIADLTAADPVARPATAHDVAARWARSLGRSTSLVTPGTVAAVLRAGPPAGREVEVAGLLDASGAGQARVLVGPEGIGRRAVARAVLRRAQLGGREAEWWPGAASDRGAEGLSAALRRLLGTDGGLGTLPERPEGASVAEAERTLSARVEEVVDALAAAPRPEPRPLLVADLEAEPAAAAQRVVEELVAASEAGRELPLGLAVVAAEHEGPGAVHLGPMRREDVADMVAARLGRGAASARLAAGLAAASGGHPRTLEALLGLMAARGDLTLGPDGWRGPPDGRVGALPEALAAAVRERLDLLPEGPSEALRAVAWLRFPATAEDVAAALDRPAVPPGALEELIGAGLVWDEADGGCRVAHEAVADTTAGWEPPGGASRAHERVLRRGAPEGLARAWHLGGEGGAAEARRVAEDRWRRWDAEGAARALDLALELAPDDPEALDRRAAVADRLGPRDVQIRCLERLMDLAGGERARLDAEARLFWALTRTADAARAEDVGREVIRKAEAQGAADVHVAARVDLANVVIQRGDYDEGEDLLRRAEALLDPSEAPGPAARVANNLGNVAAYRGRHEEALRSYTRAWELKRDEGDPVGQRIALGNMGLMCLELGRSGEALSHFARSLEAARRVGHRRGEAWCLLALGVLGLEAGALAWARRRLEAARDVARRLGDRLVACDAETTLAELTLAEGDAEGARALAERGLAAARSVESAFNVAGARAVLAAASLDRDPEEAVRLARRVVDEPGAGPPARATAWRVLAEAAARGGDLEEAAGAVEQALEDAGERPEPAVLEAAERLLRLGGRTARADAVAAEGVRTLSERMAAWPEGPWDDGVDDETTGDGPCGATWRARPHVARLLGVAGRRSGEGRTDGGSDVTKGECEWLRRVAASDAAGLEALLGGWLGDVVADAGAERGFVVVGDEVCVARDVDGDAVSGASDKLPRGALDEAARSGGAWRGASGRGAVWAGSVGEGATLVLQNRFDPAAFRDLAATPGVGRGEVLLRLRALHMRLAEAERRRDEAEEGRREDSTRSTEEILRLRRELETTREQVGPERSYPDIVFASSAMKRMLRMVDRVLDTDLPVYVHGESGTGKDLVARALHHHGARASGPFVAQNCSAIPEALFESELFGHERGAFTGAERATEGLFRRADGGTLFLDEVADLPLDLQAKLLRVLETGEVRPVGGQRTFRVDVRVVCATHRDLRERVAAGAFREDLFYRLHVLRIDVPPLRERPDDVPPLVEHFLAQRTERDGRPVRLGEGVLRTLVAYDWPGNVRQLENEVARAAILCDGEITVEDLTGTVRRGALGSERSDAAGDDADPLRALGLDRGALKARVERLERVVLREALERAEGNKSRVARDLGLSRAGLNMKLKRLGLWDPCG